MQTWASQVALVVKNPPANAWNVRGIGWEDPLEKSLATHSSILAWRIPGTVEPGRLPSMGLHRVGHDWSDLAAAATAATEAEDIKKRWQEYIEELYKKDLHDPDNHDGVITHLEPDIQECEVKWALGSITIKKLVEVMEFQLSYFKS